VYRGNRKGEARLIENSGAAFTDCKHQGLDLGDRAEEGGSDGNTVGSTGASEDGFGLDLDLAVAGLGLEALTWGDRFDLDFWREARFCFGNAAFQP
jgi:hypothetical protein